MRRWHSSLMAEWARHVHHTCRNSSTFLSFTPPEIPIARPGSSVTGKSEKTRTNGIDRWSRSGLCSHTAPCLETRSKPRYLSLSLSLEGETYIWLFVFDPRRTRQGVHVRRKRRHDEEQNPVTMRNCTRKIIISMRFNNIGKVLITDSYDYYRLLFFFPPFLFFFSFFLFFVYSRE